MLAKIATLREIEEFWNLCDLMDAHEALDLQLEMEQQAHAKAMESGGTK